MLGVLLDTFVVRALLVPSIVLLLGRWNWWPAAGGDHVGRYAAGSGLAGRVTPTRRVCIIRWRL